jgi:hypothetical protein
VGEGEKGSSSRREKRWEREGGVRELINIYNHTTYISEKPMAYHEKSDMINVMQLLSALVSWACS